MSEWQAIETAPKDGTEILAFFGPHTGVVQVSWGEAASGGFELWVVDDHKHGPFYLRGYSEPYPSHWMPLPDPPATP